MHINTQTVFVLAHPRNHAGELLDHSSTAAARCSKSLIAVSHMHTSSTLAGLRDPAASPVLNSRAHNLGANEAEAAATAGEHNTACHAKQTSLESDTARRVC
jgi:hypothetical protein